MLKNFRSYQLAIQFYKICEQLKCPRHLQDQLMRASSSIALNLAEGSERVTNADRRRFYRMAMGSTRECQAVLDLIDADTSTEKARKLGDDLGASIFNLCKAIDKTLSPTAAESREPGAESGKQS